VRGGIFRRKLDPLGAFASFIGGAAIVAFQCSALAEWDRRYAIRVHRLTDMRLNDEEQQILAGDFGPVPQQALRHQISVGDFFHAADFVPVTQAHIMADTESLGEAGVRWLEALAQTDDGQKRVRVPTITDPRGTDFAKASFLGHTASMLDLERRADR